MSENYEMNIDEIEKYIIGKKIKDMSLEEIRNFIETQGNTIILNHHIYEKQQLEIERLNNIIKEVREYIVTHKLYCFEYDDEELFEITTDKKAKDKLLEILDKGE